MAKKENFVADISDKRVLIKLSGSAIKKSLKELGAVSVSIFRSGQLEIPVSGLSQTASVIKNLLSLTCILLGVKLGGHLLPLFNGLLMKDY